MDTRLAGRSSNSYCFSAYVRGLRRLHAHGSHSIVKAARLLSFSSWKCSRHEMRHRASASSSYYWASVLQLLVLRPPWPILLSSSFLLPLKNSVSASLQHSAFPRIQLSFFCPSICAGIGFNIFPYTLNVKDPRD
ncbi:hypothetical protein DENSPDRAFT_595272 [Dentipellis sp. KUC8613]|nr:hypothetical protein DENSPDRAFT_595272 [Dentipellis sp. KUC8613]